MSKIGSFRIVAAVLSLLVVSLISACTTSTQNGNQNQNQNLNSSQNQNAAPTERVAITADSACDEQNIDQRLQKVKDKIASELSKDNELNGRIKFEVRKVNNTYLEIIIEGTAHGKNEAEDLIKILKRFMKDKCALRVVFVKNGTLPLASASSIEGFEWIACDPPMQACPDGRCLSSCEPMASPKPPANTPSNSNGG